MGKAFGHGEVSSGPSQQPQRRGLRRRGERVPARRKPDDFAVGDGPKPPVDARRAGPSDARRVPGFHVQHITLPAGAHARTGMGDQGLIGPRNRLLGIEDHLLESIAGLVEKLE